MKTTMNLTNNQHGASQHIFPEVRNSHLIFLSEELLNKDCWSNKSIYRDGTQQGATALSLHRANPILASTKQS